MCLVWITHILHIIHAHTQLTDENSTIYTVVNAYKRMLLTHKLLDKKFLPSLFQHQLKCRAHICKTSIHLNLGWKCCCSVTKSCLTFYDPMKCSPPDFPVLHHLPEFAQTHVHESVMLSNHLILRHPLLLLPSIFSSIRVFYNESASHQVAKVLELQIQHQSFQWIFRVDSF